MTRTHAETRTVILYTHAGPESFKKTLLGRVASVLWSMVKDPGFSVEEALSMAGLPATLHANGLAEILFWQSPARKFLTVLDQHARFRQVAQKTVARSDWVAIAMKHPRIRQKLRDDVTRALQGLPWQRLEHALFDMRTAFASAPSQSDIDLIGRIVLAHSPLPSVGTEATLANFREERPPGRVDLWLEEMGWPVLVKDARAWDHAFSALRAGKAEFIGDDIVTLDTMGVAA